MVVQLARDRIARPVAPADEPLHEPLDKPFRHRFARMLARDDPHFLLRGARFVGCAEHDERHRPPFDRAPQLDDTRLRHLLHRAEKFGMALFAVRLEIRVMDAVEFGRMIDRQHLPVVRRRHAEPVDPVVARDRAIVAPAGRIRAVVRVLECHHATLAARARQPEVEPLREFGAIVAAHAQPDRVRALARYDVDRARIEIARNRESHCISWLRRPRRAAEYADSRLFKRPPGGGTHRCRRSTRMRRTRSLPRRNPSARRASRSALRRHSAPSVRARASHES